MSFIRSRGKTKTVHLPVTPSTTFSKGAIVSFASGFLIEATSSTIALSHVGVIKKAVKATDSDYADARKVPVEVPVENFVEWIGDVTSGLVAADVGLLVDLTNATTINRGASTIDAAQCVGVISSTKGLFRLNFGGSTGMIS